MDKEKKPYIFVGLVCVWEKYQGQGYARNGQYTLKFLVRIRQNFVPGVSDCSIALDIGIDQPMQVSIVLFQLFQVSVGLVAGKHCRKHKRRHGTKDNPPTKLTKITQEK